MTTSSGHKNLDTQHLTRLPMHDYDIEELVVSSIIIHKSIRNKIASMEPGDFYDNELRTGFINIKQEIESGNINFDINAMPFRTPKLKECVFRYDALLASWDYYFKRLKHLSNLRKMERIAFDIETACQEDRDDILIRDISLKALNNIKPHDLKDITTRAEVNNEYDEVLGYDWRKQLPTGFEALDNVINGFRNSSFYAIAGVPGVGKTTFMLNIMQNIAQQNKKILFACLEMPYREIQNKFISRLTELSTTRLTGFNHRNTEEVERASIKTAREMFKSYNIYFIGRNGLSVQDIADKIECLSKVDIVFVDYLQLIRPSLGKTRYEQITQISRELKSIATKYDIPVVTIASINRANITRIEKKPQVSDFRDSGNIEYDLDCALLLYRPAQFKSDVSESYTELNIGKSRNSKANVEFEMDFVPEHSKFVNMKIKGEEWTP